MCKPNATPEAGLYDTSSAVHVLLKNMARVKITQAKRNISPELFNAKNNQAIIKGIFLTKGF